MLIPIDNIIPNPEQPRKEFDVLELENLAESIRLHGLINPISVEAAADGCFILIDGERRWRACRMAGLVEIEASVRPGLNGSGQLERLVLATTANLQHADMNPMEKAQAFQQLQDIGLSQAEIARTSGLSAGSISNYLLLLRLPDPIQALVRNGELNAGVRGIRSLLDITDPDTQLIIARVSAKKRLPESGVVALARRMQQGKKVAKRKTGPKSASELSVTWAGRWNMIAQAGNPHLSEDLKQACLNTCQACNLFEEASPKMCRDCPAVDLLKFIVKVRTEVP